MKGTVTIMLFVIARAALAAEEGFVLVDLDEGSLQAACDPDSCAEINMVCSVCIRSSGPVTALPWSEPARASIVHRTKKQVFERQLADLRTRVRWAMQRAAGDEAWVDVRGDDIPVIQAFLEECKGYGPEIQCTDAYPGDQLRIGLPPPFYSTPADS